RAGSSSGLAACLPHEASASTPAISSRRDDRADIFALQRREHLAALEAVDDLQLLAPARTRQVVDDDALDDQVGQVARGELARGDPRDVRRLRILLRIVGVQAVL